MHQPPAYPPVEEAPPDTFASGHLWILEFVDGGVLRFRVDGSGLVRFGDATRVYDHGSLPAEYAAGARHVRETLDLAALREGTADPTAFTFVGRATYRRRLDYAWGRLPPFLGYDIWSADRETFLPPDVVERAYTGIGLQPANALAKEVPTRDIEPGTYSIPDSAWRDGPALGVVFRSKTGGRAKRIHAHYRSGAATTARDADTPDEADDLVERWLAADRIAAVVERLEAAGQPADHATVRYRLREMLLREEYDRLVHTPGGIDAAEIEDALSGRVAEWFADRRG